MKQCLLQLGVEVDDRLLSREKWVNKVAQQDALKLTSHQQQQVDREIATKYSIAVVEECKLQLKTPGDQAILTRVLGCHKRYAKKVMESVEGGKETLFEQIWHRDSVVASHWPKLVHDFLHQPQHSRFVPGNDSVSVRYGTRVPKILLFDSKLKLVNEFLDENPACPFKARVLLREIPRNFVTAGPQDFG